MSNTNGLEYSGFEICGNLTVREDCCNSFGNGSIEASGSLYINEIVEYNLNTGVRIEQTLLENGIVNISSSLPGISLTSGALILQGGFFVNNNSKIKGVLTISNTTESISLTSGSLIVNAGASIHSNLNVGNILQLYNTTPSTNSSLGALLSLGGISIQNTSNAISCINGGALTVLGGASIAKDLYICGTLYAPNLSIGNISVNSLTSNNINSINIVTTNANISSLVNSNLINTNSTITNSLLINSSIINLNTNIATIGTLLVDYEYSFNSTIVNLNLTNGTFSNFIGTNMTINNLNILGVLEYSNIINNLSTANISSQYSTITNLLLTNGSFGNIICINFTSSNILTNYLTSNVGSIGNLYLINETVQNLISSYGYISNLVSINSNVSNGNFINLTASNIVSFNQSVNNLYSNVISNSNLYSNYGSIGSLYITGTDPSISNTNGVLIVLGGITILNTNNAISSTYGGGLTILGGASFGKNIYIGGTVNALSVSASNLYISNEIYSSYINSTNITNIALQITGTDSSVSSTSGSIISYGGIGISNTMDAISITNGGGLTDAGGASIAKSLYVGGTANITSISAGNIYINGLLNSVSAYIINGSITNLIGTNATILNTTFTNTTSTNLVNINITNSNFNSQLATIQNLVVGNISFGNAIGNNLTSNYITNNIYFTTPLATIGNLINTNASINSININNGTFGNLLGTYIYSYNGTIDTLISSNTSIGSLNVNNSTLGNILSYNINTNNIIGTKANFTYLTVGSLYVPNIITTNLTLSNLMLTELTVGSLVSNNQTVSNIYIINGTYSNLVGNFLNSSNGIINNLYSTTGNIYNIISNNSSINSLNLSIGTFGNVIINNAYSTNINTNSIYSTNGNFTNFTSQNAFIINSTTSNIYINNGSFSNLVGNSISSINIFVTNQTSTNIYNTNLYSTNITTNSFITNNATISNSNINNSTIGNLNIIGTITQNGSTFYTSQWTSYGQNIAFTTGNVGINTTTPNYTLEVDGSGYFQTLNVNSVISTSNLYAMNETVANVNSTSIITSSIQSINAFFTNETALNLISTNATISSLIVSNLNCNNGYLINLTSNNVSSVFATFGSLLINSNIPSYNATIASLVIYGGLSINNTTNSINISSGGGLTIRGGLAVSLDTYIGGMASLLGGLDVNGTKITNCTAPTLNLDVVNLWYLQNKFTTGNVSGNFTKGQVLIATTGGNITGYSSLTFDYTENLLILYGTNDATSVSSGGTLQVYGGVSIDLQLFVGSNAHILGYLDMNNNRIMNVATCTMPYEVANKYYVDSKTYGNINGNFTQGQVIIGGLNNTLVGFSNFEFDGTLVSILTTIPSIGLGSGGSLNINGGVSILGNVYIGNGLDVNQQKITNCTAPTLGLDVVNLWYLQNKFTTGNVFGNFTQGQIIVSSTGGNIIGYPNFIYNTNGSIYIGGGLSLGNSILTGIPDPINPKDAVNLEYLQYFLGINNGDIKELSVTLSNNILTPINVPGFVFNNSLVSSFEAFAYLQIPELNIYDQFQIKGILEGNSTSSNWVINSTFIGVCQNNVKFSIINNSIEGQIQYINKNTTGNAKLIFRALTTSQGIYTNITSGTINIRSVNMGGTGTTFFTNGCLLLGNGINPIKSDINLTYINETLYLGNSSPSVNLTTPGAMLIEGGISIIGNVFIGNGLDVNQQRITNCTGPNLDLDVANKWYVDQHTNASISNLIGTIDAINATTGGTLTDFGGAGIAKSLYVGTKLYVNNINLTPSLGDLSYEQLFLANNNQNILDNIIGFKFNNSIVNYFEAIVSVNIIAMNNLTAGFKINGIQLNTSGNWQINTSFIGQNTGLKFKINNIGQIQYTSTNIAGFISSTLKFRALTLSN